MSERAEQSDASRVAAVVKAVHSDSPLHDTLGIGAGAVDALERQAYRMYQAGRLDDTQVLAQGIVALDVTRPYPHLLLGDVYAQREQWDDAHASFEEAYRLGEASGLAAYKSGLALIQVGRAEQAERRLREAVEIASDGAAPAWPARAEGLLERLREHTE
jgi:tetratricopeptide (TPR) repeat protein